MSKISLIIITGLPCTGKTTIAEKIAKEFRLPLVAKDKIKELLFDKLGHKDIKWSEKLSEATYDIIFHVVETILKADKSVIVESNFSPKLSDKKFIDLKKKYDFTPVQVRCVTNGEILLERFKKRADSGERHPGHVDGVLIEKLKPFLLRGKIEALNIGGEIINVDTSDFNKVNYHKLIGAIKSTTNVR